VGGEVIRKWRCRFDSTEPARSHRYRADRPIVRELPTEYQAGLVRRSIVEINTVWVRGAKRRSTSIIAALTRTVARKSAIVSILYRSPLADTANLTRRAQHPSQQKSTRQQPASYKKMTS